MESDVPEWTVREMLESEVDTVVAGVFRAHPYIEPGEPNMQEFGGRRVDFSFGGMVREEVASMFTGARYGLPFKTKTVVAVKGGRIVASVSMYGGEGCWQMGYIVRAEGDDGGRITQDLAVALLSACQEWGELVRIVPRQSPPWFHV